MSGWVGVEEIATHIGASPHTIRKWCQKGVIPHGRACLRLVFDVEEVDRWLRQRGSPGRLDRPVSQDQAEKQAREEEAAQIAERIMADS